MKRHVQPQRLFGGKRLSHLPKKNYGSFRVAEQLQRAQSRLKVKGRDKPRKGGTRVKHYCSSQAQNSVPGEQGKKIRVKFNKSTFCKPGQVIKRKLDPHCVIKAQAGANAKARTGLRTEEANERKGYKRDSGISSEPVSYLKSKRNLLESKSIKRMTRVESAQEAETENYFSVTSEDKSKQLTLLPSVMSVGTDNSLYSNQPREQDEFNLYCVDKSHRTNNSGSQGDIIYKKRRKNKRKGAQTEHPPPRLGPLQHRAKEAPRSFKNVMMGLRGKRWKKRSFHAEHHN